MLQSWPDLIDPTVQEHQDVGVEAQELLAGSAAQHQQVRLRGGADHHQSACQVLDLQVGLDHCVLCSRKTERLADSQRQQWIPHEVKIQVSV